MRNLGTMSDELLFIIRLLASPVYLLLYILPGFAVSGYLIAQHRFYKEHLLLVSIFFSNLIIYFIFWVYLYNNLAGIAFSLMTVGVGLLSLVKKRAFFAELAGTTNFYLPLSLTALAGWFYLCVLFGVGEGNYLHEMHINRRFLPWTMGADNIIALYISDLLYNGDNVRSLNFGMYKWLFTDRPPLFYAVVSYLMPFSFLFGKNYKAIELFGKGNEALGLFYQFAGTMVQSTWIAGLWSLCGYFRLKAVETWFVHGACILSGFFMYHTLYLWPKVITIPMVVMCFVSLLKRSDEDVIGFSRIAVGAAAGALAYLFHGGAAFSLLALGTMLLLKPYRPGLKQLAAGFVVFISVLMPWNMYTRFCDPPGNRLFNLHFAGHYESDNLSTLEAVVNGYSSLDLKTIARNKLTNFKIIFRIPNMKEFLNISEIRTKSYDHMIYSLGLLNLGFLIILYLKFVKRPPPRLSFTLKVLLSFTVLYIVYWALLLFGPTGYPQIGIATLHQGSFANYMFLCLTAGLLICRLPSTLVDLIFYFNAALVFYIWIVGNKGAMTGNVQYDVALTIMGCLSLGGIMHLLQKIKTDYYQCG
jgi:hypothetical protein